MPKVLVLGGNPGDDSMAVKYMFHENGWDVTGFLDARGVDLVCFCGGTDVDPAIYGEEPGPFTQKPDVKRDTIERGMFEYHFDTPKVGICRGAQLLNVLSGGKMIQHIGCGYSGDVKTCLDDFDGLFMELRVDHHQGMVRGENHDHTGTIAWYEGTDILSIMYYEHTKSLCFQPHPEWGHEPTRELFFQLIQQHLGVS